VRIEAGFPLTYLCQSDGGRAPVLVV